eukprot:3019870-Pleurochrysis_carterae.AAC.1
MLQHKPDCVHKYQAQSGCLSAQNLGRGDGKSFKAAQQASELQCSARAGDTKSRGKMLPKLVGATELRFYSAA